MALIDSGVLNLEEIFVNYFSGTFAIFFFVAMFFFTFLGAKYKMSNGVFLILMALFVILMGGYGYEALIGLTIVIIGLFVYWVLQKMFKS